jgi:hypothetical protein
VVNDPSKKGWYVRIHTGMLETNPEQAGYKRKPKTERPNISRLAKEDPREVEGYGKTYQEAKGWGQEPWHGEQGDIEREWHGLGAKTPERINPAELLKGTSKMKSEDIPQPSIKDDIVEVLDNYNMDNYKDLAKVVADLVKDQYGSHIKMDFLTALNRELNTSKE